MSVSALVPYRPGDEYHDRNWVWVEQRWRRLLPEVELVVMADDGGGSPAEFNHPLALNRAAARASGDLFVVSDVDLVPDPVWTAAATKLVVSGRASWVMTSEYHSLDEASSSRVLGGEPTGPVSDYGLVEPPASTSSAPPLVISREGFEAAGGYDERIGWWGADDSIFRIRADTLWGPMERCAGPAVHLWHPSVPSGHGRQRDQQALVARYHAAAGNPAELRAI